MIQMRKELLIKTYTWRCFASASAILLFCFYSLCVCIVCLLFLFCLSDACSYIAYSHMVSSDAISMDVYNCDVCVCAPFVFAPFDPCGARVFFFRSSFSSFSFSKPSSPFPLFIQMFAGVYKWAIIKEVECISFTTTRKRSERVKSNIQNQPKKQQKLIEWQTDGWACARALAHVSTSTRCVTLIVSKCLLNVM